MSCLGSPPTFDNPSTWSLSHDGSSCNNTASINISAPCGSSGYTVKLIRNNGTITTVYTASIPDGPISGMNFSYTDSPPCGAGSIDYTWEIFCDAALQSSSSTQGVTQGDDPSLSEDTLTTANCANTLHLRVINNCGSCSGNAVLYRNFEGAPDFSAGEIISTQAVNQGPADQTFTYTDTPPCGRGTYYYQWRVELPQGNFTGTLHSTTQGGPALITASNAIADAHCNINATVQIDKVCGECAGTVKLFRNGLQIFSQVVPAGPLIGYAANFTESPGDGSWSYQWKVYNNLAIVDDTSLVTTVHNTCLIDSYDPQNLPLPPGQLEKHIVLVQVTRTGPRSYQYTDYQMLADNEQRTEWWYHKNGGCGSFRLLTHELFPDIMSDVLGESWEIHVRIKLGGETHYTTWYRGVIRAIRSEEQGAEQLTDVRGYGYVEMLDNVQVQKKYPAGMTVKQIVDDIMDTLVCPNTRIIRPIDLDPTNGDSGADPSPYITKTDLHFECSALKAIKFLAELQGNREFGVDGAGLFYFRTSSATVVKSFYDGLDLLTRIAGGKTFVQSNELKVAGKAFGGRDYLQVRGDVTDISNNGLYESPVEVPWVTGDADASAWADNIISKSKGSQAWSIFEWKNVDDRVDANHPLGSIRVYGGDISNDFSTYDVGKIQYVEGGWPNRNEIREMGQPMIQKSIDEPPLKARFYLGYYPRDVIEELEVRIREQVEFMKGRWKQFRYPVDITNQTPDTGHLPGELLHFRPVDITNLSISRDITNYDVINNPSEIQDLTNPRGVLLSWLAKQWTKLSTRRTFKTALPTRGLFIGEIVSLVTDVTNGQFGVIYWWTGNAWSVVGSGGGGGGGGGGGVSLSNNPPTTIHPDDTANPGVGVQASRDDHQHAIATDVAVDVQSANAEGTSTSFSRADHQHRGVRSINVDNFPLLYGAIDITNGVYIKVTQVGNQLKFDVDDLVAYINTLQLAAYNPITDPVFWALMG